MDYQRRRSARDLEQILDVCRSRGQNAVLDGDSVAVFVRRRRALAEGGREVHYDIRHIKTITEAYTAAY